MQELDERSRPAMDQQQWNDFHGAQLRFWRAPHEVDLQAWNREYVMKH